MLSARHLIVIHIFLIAISANVCIDKPCGEYCGLNSFPGVCDGNGLCRDVTENPCVIHGCEGKQCGDDCLLGDIVGACDINGECDTIGGIPNCRTYASNF